MREDVGGRRERFSFNKHFRPKTPPHFPVQNQFMPTTPHRSYMNKTTSGQNPRSMFPFRNHFMSKPSLLWNFTAAAQTTHASFPHRLQRT